MLGLTTRQLRVCLVILGIFLFVYYATPPSCKRSALRELFASQGAPPSTGSKLAPNTHPLRVHWGNEPVPETVVLLHKIPGQHLIMKFVRRLIRWHPSGWTVFKNLYIFSETIYIVTSQPETLPPTRFMISNGLDLNLSVANEPTNKTLSIISPKEAKQLFGTSAGLLDGLSVSLHFCGSFNRSELHLVHANRLAPVHQPHVSLPCG
jgi:hypothetical protein